MDHLLRSKTYKSRVLKQIRASIGTIQMAVHTLSLKIDMFKETKGHAARVLLELAPELQVENFPGILLAISSLLSINKKDANSGSPGNDNMVTKEFKLLGVQILEKLVDDEENCTQVKDAKDLIPKIVELIKCREGMLGSQIDMDIVQGSLLALLKLVSTPGENGGEFRNQVSGNLHVMEVIKKILAGRNESHPVLLVHATGILAFLTLNGTARKEIRGSRLIIQMLISFLAGEINTVQDPITRKITKMSKSCIETILAETTVEDMDNILHVLSNESTDHKIGVGKLLQNLRAYQGEEFTELFTRIEALPKVLETMDLAVGKTEQSDSSDEHASHGKGKLLESFIGLTVQICINGNEMVFTNVLWTANITIDSFVQKLKMILTVYKSQTTDFSGIRRVVIQQINWMMQKNPAYIVVFKKHELDMILKETAETATKLENYLHFHSGAGAIEHEESFSSIVSKSLELIAGSYA
uniref:Uncharacterized protein n=1 Tax=Leersia perrieri TaxID=77586 RepID=A0A0D9V1M1_9ORYZ